MNFEKVTYLTKYERVVLEYQLGQMSESVWEDHLKDPMFSNYVKIRFGK